METPSREVVLHIDEIAGISRRNEIVRSGVPFPEGVLSESDNLMLFDRSNNPIYAEFKPLAHWPDGSVKWLLATFTADLSPNQSSQYMLKCNHGVQAQEPNRKISIIEDDESYNIDTGALRCGIGKSSFSVLRNLAIIRSGEWNVVSPQGLNFIVEDMWRQRAYANFSRERVNEQPSTKYSVEVEEQTPLRATFKVSGSAFGVAGELLHYTFRVTFQAGSQAVKLSVTLRNQQPDRYLALRRSLLTLDLAVPPENCEFGLDDGSSSMDVPSEGELRLVQTGPTSSQPDKDWNCTCGIAGDKLSSGSKASGWALCKTGEAYLGMALRRFSRQHPKGFTFSCLGAWIELVPMTNEPYLMPNGVEKTYDILLHPGTSEDEIRDEVRAFEHPLFAAASPELYCSSGVFGPVIPFDKAKYADHEHLCEVYFDALNRGRDSRREYGDIDFGDTEDEPGSDGSTGEWRNNEYDVPHCCFLLFARTGDRRYLDWGIDAVRHQMDIDTIHHNPDNPELVGGQHKHCFGHVGGRRYGRKRSLLNHFWTEGMAEYHFLTGNPRPLDILPHTGDWIDAEFTRGVDTPRERDYGWALIGAEAVYQATGDTKYLETMKKIAETVFRKSHPTRGVWLNTWGTDENGNPLHGNKIFMVGILLEGMIRYHKLTADERAADFIVKTAKTIVDEAWIERDSGFYYTPSLRDRGRGRTTDQRELYGLIYAYRLCGDTRLLEVAVKNFNTGIKTLLDRLDSDGSTTDSKSFAIFVRATPHFLAILDGMGKDF